MNIRGSMGRVLMQQTYHSTGIVGAYFFIFIYLFIYLFIFFFLLFWLLLLTGGVNITKVFSEIYYPPIPNKMVALSTGREVTNQVENNKGVSLIFFFFFWWGWNQCSSIKGEFVSTGRGTKKKYVVLLKPEIFF